MSQKGSTSPRLDVELLLSKALECKRLDLYLEIDRPLNREELDRFKALLLKRASGCPVAYLLESKEFYSLSFEVNPSVLIPRPETEILVKAALDEVERFQEEVVWILDLGTGSGNIAISLAVQEKRILGVATDLSPDALFTAARNAHTHGVRERIMMICGDLLTPLHPVRLKERIHLILSNPPYIPDSQRESLPPDVGNYEPPAALFCGEDGLSFHKRILQESLPYLAKGGAVILEIGEETGPELLESSAALDGYSNPVLLNDYQGKHRVFKAVKKGG